MKKPHETDRVIKINFEITVEVSTHGKGDSLTDKSAICSIDFAWNGVRHACADQFTRACSLWIIHVPVSSYPTELYCGAGSSSGCYLSEHVKPVVVMFVAARANVKVWFFTK
jgi:hypothetical protein